MSTEVADRAAVIFAAGQSVADAVADGQAHLLANGFPAALTAQIRLHWANGVDLSALRF